MAGGRYDDIQCTVTTALAPGEHADQLADRCPALQALGADHVVLIASEPWHGVNLATVVETATLLKAA